MHNQAVDTDSKSKETDKQINRMYDASKRLEHTKKVDDVMRESKTALYDPNFNRRFDFTYL